MVFRSSGRADPRDLGFQDWMIGMILDWGSLSICRDLGMLAQISASAKNAQVALLWLRLRYVLSYVRLMALFLASMLRSLFPPLLCGAFICERLTVSLLS